MGNDFGKPVSHCSGSRIVGKVAAAGNHVIKFKTADLTAVGCMVNSCGHCEYCNKGIEQFCDEGMTFSFNSEDKMVGSATLSSFSN